MHRPTLVARLHVFAAALCALAVVAWIIYSVVSLDYYGVSIAHRLPQLALPLALSAGHLSASLLRPRPRRRRRAGVAGLAGVLAAATGVVEHLVGGPLSLDHEIPFELYSIALLGAAGLYARLALDLLRRLVARRTDDPALQRRTVLHVLAAVAGFYAMVVPVISGEAGGWFVAGIALLAATAWVLPAVAWVTRKHPRRWVGPLPLLGLFVVVMQDVDHFPGLVEPALFLGGLALGTTALSRWRAKHRRRVFAACAATVAFALLVLGLEHGSASGMFTRGLLLVLSGAVLTVAADRLTALRRTPLRAAAPVAFCVAGFTITALPWVGVLPWSHALLGAAVVAAAGLGLSFRADR